MPCHVQFMALEWILKKCASCTMVRRILVMGLYHSCTNAMAKDCHGSRVQGPLGCRSMQFVLQVTRHAWTACSQHSPLLSIKLRFCSRDTWSVHSSTTCGEFLFAGAGEALRR